MADNYSGTSGELHHPTHGDLAIGAWTFTEAPLTAGRIRSAAGTLTLPMTDYVASGNVRLRLHLEPSSDRYLSVRAVITGVVQDDDPAYYWLDAPLRWQFATVGEWRIAWASEVRFLRAIIAEPFVPDSAVAPALIYADWLEEQADDEQCELAKAMRGAFPRTLAFRRELFGEKPQEQNSEKWNAGGGCLVHSIEEATPISPQMIDGWVEQLTAATGVQFTKLPLAEHRDDFVLSPAHGVYVRMGEKPDDSWII